ncbi:MAG TPA: hypothetical protein VGL09_09905 [Methylomirabilota bacterium]|jgi:hypothetical protein
MNLTSPSNVFYLPAPIMIPATPPPPPTRWSVLRARAFCGWQRFRLTVREVAMVIRRAGRRLEDDYPRWLDVAPAAAPVPRFARPARVLDFESARARRRPSPS